MDANKLIFTNTSTRKGKHQVGKLRQRDLSRSWKSSDSSSVLVCSARSRLRGWARRTLLFVLPSHRAFHRQNVLTADDGFCKKTVHRAALIFVLWTKLTLQVPWQNQLPPHTDIPLPKRVGSPWAWGRSMWWLFLWLLLPLCLLAMIQVDTRAWIWNDEVPGCKHSVGLFSSPPALFFCHQNCTWEWWKSERLLWAVSRVPCKHACTWKTLITSESS